MLILKLLSLKIFQIFILHILALLPISGRVDRASATETVGSGSIPSQCRRQSNRSEGALAKSGRGARK